MSGYLALTTVINGDGSQMVLNGAAEGAEKSGGLLPREELLAAVKARDEPRLRHGLQHAAPAEVDFVFSHPDSCALIHIAAQNDSSEIVRLLLESGASPDIPDLRGKKFTASHYAAQRGHVDVLRVLLQKGANVNVKEGEFGRSCLHLLALKWQSNEDQYSSCLKELLKQDRINIDGKDSSGATPLFLAAQKGWEFMVRALVMKGANLDTKVGSKITSEIIKKNFPNLLDTIDLSSVGKVVRYYGDDLFEAIQDEDQDRFLGILSDLKSKEELSKSSVLEEDHGMYTLLTYACDHAMYDFVDVLLKEGADVLHHAPDTKLTPVLYAAKNGYYRVMEVIIDHMKKNGLLKKGSLNVTDRKGESPLHKVVKRELLSSGKEAVNYRLCLELLLNVKEYINVDAQDEFNNTPLHYAVLCDDQSFVRRLLINGANLGIKNRFGTLAITRIQPFILEEVLNECVKCRNNVTDRDFEIILRYSLLAPANVGDRPETECLKFLGRSKPHRHLLRHPIIDTFLSLKWQRIRQYYYMNLAAYFTFITFLTAYILLFYGNPPGPNGGANNGTAAGESSDIPEHFGIKIFLQAMILLFCIGMAFRELVNFIVTSKVYVTSVENWLEVAILVMTIFAVFIPINVVSRQGLSAWLILLSWLELLLILGRHPLLSVYITMFTTVTLNFLKFILMFSIIIVAFSLSFYLVFQVDGGNFETYTKTILKTVAMSTGEIEYTELPLSEFPISSHLLFIIFVFLIVLVLMNLLNGLAVSDIQQIQQEAELVSYRSRIELISYIEAVLLAHPFQQLKDARLCDSKMCCQNCFPESNPAFRLLNYLGRRTLMFRSCLKTHEIKVYPNRGKDRWYVCSCHSFLLEESQIEAVKNVVLSEADRVSDRLAGLENRVDKMAHAIMNLTDVVQKNLTVSPVLE